LVGFQGGYRGVRGTYIGRRGGALACEPSRGAYGGWTLRESARRGEEDGPDGRDWAGGGRLGRVRKKKKERTGPGEGSGPVRGGFGPRKGNGPDQAVGLKTMFFFLFSFAKEQNKFNLNLNSTNSNSN